MKKLSSQSTTSSGIQMNGTEEGFCEEIGRPCFIMQLDAEVKGWLFELQDDKRLNIALKAFRAIDKQMQIGADVRQVVGEVLKEIRMDFGNVKDAMDRSVKDYLKDIVAQAKASKEETENFVKKNIEDQTSHLVEKVDLLLKQGKSIEEVQKALKEDTQSFVKTLITSQMEVVVDKIETLLKQEKSIEEIQKELKEDTKSFVKEIVQEQVKVLVDKVELLLKQGKTIDEIEKELKSALGGLENAQSGLNTLLQSFKVSSVRGEKGELELLAMINEAFLTDKNVVVKPLGGPDATDMMVKFCCHDLEIGEVLIESKASQTWSNDYLEQVKADMKRYGVATAILAVQKTPRDAKVRGYTIDDTLGIIVITTPEMTVSTLAMFYDIYLANYRLGKKTVNLQTIMDDKDILCHIQDNMRCLDDCKKINDCVDKAHRDIHTHVSTIMNRLKENNDKIALILSKHGKTIEDESESSPKEEIAQTRLDRIPTETVKPKEDLSHLPRTPVTREELAKLLTQKPGWAGTVQTLLRKLQMEGVVYTAKFVAGARGTGKYGSWDIFGKLACKTYYCRFDCPEEVAELLIENLPLDKLKDMGFRRSLKLHLKQIIRQNAVDAFERKLATVL